MHLLFGPHLLIIEFLALLLPSLILLLLDEGLYHSRLGHMLVVLMIKEVFVLSFLALRVTYILPHLVVVSLLLHQYLLPLIFLLRLMNQGHLRLLVHLLLQAYLLLLLRLHVPSALHHDITCLLPCLIDLLVSTQLLLLQQVDSICQQLQVFLRALPRNLGCHQLAMQGLIIVLFIRS